MEQINRNYLLTVFLLILITLNNAIANKVETINRGYIFTAPKKILAGETESGCLSFHNLEPPAHVLLELLSPASANSDEEILASTSTYLETGVETCLELSIPDRAQMTYTMGRLRLKIRFDKHPEYHVNTEKDVYIEYDSSIIFVETDKPIYKPGQDVNIRLLALTHDLKPWKRTIPKVWIETPAEIKVAQWTNLSVDRGLVQLVFPLSSEPSYGTWRIKVEKKKSHPHLVHTSTFEVKKYVLPKFQVTIKGPSYILADAENATWIVCAKYSYGEPVRGTLKIKSTSQTPSWRRRHNFPEINYETRVESPDGCIEPFTISNLAMGLPNWEVAPNSIVISANLTEDGTNTTEVASFRAVVVHQALKLEFLPYTPKYFKVGLPYHGKLRVLRHDDTPAPNEKIQMCLRVRGKDEWAEIVVECKNLTSSPMGFVNFIVPPQHKNIVLLSFIATGIEYPTKYYSLDKRWRVFMNQPSANIRVYAWYSPSDSYLAVARGDQPIICGEKYPFNVMYTVPSEGIANKSIAFHYSINSKGDLLIFGHVKHKPHPDSILNYSEFKNVLGGSTDSGSANHHHHHHHHYHHHHHHHHHLYNSTNRSENTHNIVYRFPLSVKVTPSMAPISELLLYYVRHDGETVATTYTIEVGGNCFENRIKTSWSDEMKNPGEMVRYNVEAAPWSLCGISVIDQATIFLSDSKRSLLDTETVFDQTKRFHLNGDSPTLHQRTWSHCKKTTQPETSIEEIDRLPSPAVEAPPIWDLRAAVAWKKRSLSEDIHRRKRSFFISGGNNYVDAMQAFDDFGVIVMTNLILETRPCPQVHWSMGSFEGINFDLGLRGVDEPDRMWGKMPLAIPLLNIGAIESSVISDVSYVDQLYVGGSPRSFFPETWLWELVSTGKDGKATIKRSLPDSITNWVGHTVCISSNYGLGIAPPIKVTAFQPFFLDYSLPYSVKRGELLRMKVSLFNYMQHNLPVNIHLLSAPGFDLDLSNSLAKYCLHPRKSIVHEYLLRPRVIGEINITVTATVVTENGETCQHPKDINFTQDTIIKPILVQPEGFPMENIKSSFMCPKDFNDDSSISWNITLPEDVVVDSARAFVSLAGDLLGSALENLDNLIRLPFGCGEQNLILFVPNIHVLNYLDATHNQMNPEIRKKAIKNMEKGYQRELNYRHPDGSYSAFGPESVQTSGSMWLTAFVVKSFAQSKKYIHIDDRDLKLSVKWILKKQLENGCFPLIGTVFHKDMKGGLEIDKQNHNQNHSIALTAYVLISLIESGKTLPPSIISNALDCLLNDTNYKNQSNPYTLVLVSYALSLLEHPNANASMNLLISKATRLHDLLWWENRSRPSASLSIEMTAYSILSLVKLGGNANMALAMRAVRWLSKQRNIQGGFVSTQDTIMGLEALAKYATVMVTNSTDLSILLTAGDMDKVIRMNDDNRMVFVQTRLPILPTFLEIFVEGEGCVLVQIHLKYNVMNYSGSEAFDLSIRTEPVASGDECSMQKINVCTRYNMADGESNMALLQIGMISGFVPDKGSLQALVEQSELTHVKRFEDDHDSISIYFDKLTSDINCISLLVLRENIVENPEPANVKIFDYYQSELFDTKNYTLYRNCTTNISNISEVHLNDLSLDVSTFKPVVSVSRILDQKIEEKSNKIVTEGLVENKNRDNMLFGDDLETGVTISRARITEVTSESSDYGKYEADGSGYHDLDDGNMSPAHLNPSFVIINHELDTPDGVEGPPPVYVKPSFDISKTDGEFESENTSTNGDSMKLAGLFNDSVKSNNSIGNFSQNTSEICPQCSEKVPIGIKEIYCEASSVIKVAVRRSRRIRLLLDFHTDDNRPKRLHSTFTLGLHSQCICPVIDRPGSLAMIITTKSDESLLNADPYQLYQLNGSAFIYPVPNIAGTPVEINDAKSACTIL